MFIILVVTEFIAFACKWWREYKGALLYIICQWSGSAHVRTLAQSTCSWRTTNDKRWCPPWKWDFIAGQTFSAISRLLHFLLAFQAYFLFLRYIKASLHIFIFHLSLCQKTAHSRKSFRTWLTAQRKNNFACNIYSSIAVHIAAPWVLCQPSITGRKSAVPILIYSCRKRPKVQAPSLSCFTSEKVIRVYRWRWIMFMYKLTYYIGQGLWGVLMKVILKLQAIHLAKRVR